MASRPLHTLSLPPATLSALTRAGYETVRDIAASTPEQLASDARIPLHASQAVFSATQTARLPPSLTQSAATMAGQHAIRFKTGCQPVDAILDGGLKRGFVLELSGPPGACTEALAVDMARAFLAHGQGVLFVDMHNMTSAAQLSAAVAGSSPLRTVTADDAALMLHTTLHTLPALMVFLHKLPSYLDQHPTTRLLVLNSLWFPFQGTSSLPLASRTALLERTRQALAHACAAAGLSVVVTTALSTKLLAADGSPATFDTGARAVMVPQPGHSYLPPGRSYRLMLVPQTRTAGAVRLLSSPTHAYAPNQPALREAPYELVAGRMRAPAHDGGPPA